MSGDRLPDLAALVRRLQELADEGYYLSRPYGDLCDKCGTTYLESGINLGNLIWPYVR